MSRPTGRSFPESLRVEIRKKLVSSGLTASKVARELGVDPNTVYNERRKLMEAGEKVLNSKAEQTRAEAHDASFWRRKFNTLSNKMGEIEHRLEQMAGLRDIPVRIPDWMLSSPTGERGHSVIGLLISDVHDGEQISADEINGINSFNPEICEQRLRRYYEASCIIGQRWAADTDCKGALVSLAGDLISGDIHEELRMTNALTSQEQVGHSVEMHTAGLEMIADTFGAVHVVGVPGNHGRPTVKPTAKLYSWLSYDTLILSMIEARFREDPRFTFQFGAAKDQITPIFGRTVFTTHGDKIGTKGGMGFAGPVLPIVRGSKKIEAQQAGIGRRPDLIQFGHYHTTSNPGNILSNGSVPGYSEYGDDIRAAVEPPQQWLYLLHSKWWLRERLPIQLVEPGIPEKPRVRLPAGWQETA